ncbi:MAG: Rieske 2Fe-2S domain-containing protein [Hydrogenophilaceae bacterium]|nr:Rieske 2Fe-2S domain-containing protein [Hydrogenophilaceae bacterium]
MADDSNVICASGDLEDGGKGVRFNIDWKGQKTPAFVIRHKGVAYAFLNQCGHVPVELDWQEGEFFDAEGVYLVCATHGALYDPAKGDCIGGRCNGRGLTPVPVEECDSRIRLLKYQLIK